MSEEFKLRCQIIDQYGEDSEEYRAHMRRVDAESERIKRSGNVLAVAFFILIALVGMYLGGGGYGRYTADAYDWMETK